MQHSALPAERFQGLSWFKNASSDTITFSFSQAIDSTGCQQTVNVPAAAAFHDNAPTAQCPANKVIGSVDLTASNSGSALASCCNPSLPLGNFPVKVCGHFTLIDSRNDVGFLLLRRTPSHWMRQWEF
jgi:hypothetical protein